MVDSSDLDRIKESKTELFKVLAEPELANVPLLIYADKQDVSHSLDTAKLIDAFELDEIKNKNRSWKLQGCSAVKK